jgi:hypothetical protein
MPVSLESSDTRGSLLAFILTDIPNQSTQIRPREVGNAENAENAKEKQMPLAERGLLTDNTANACISTGEVSHVAKLESA